MEPGYLGWRFRFTDEGGAARRRVGHAGMGHRSVVARVFAFFAFLGFLLVAPASGDFPAFVASAEADPVQRASGDTRADRQRWERVDRVGERLFLAATPFCKGCLPRILIENGDDINAHAQADTISISRPLIDLAQNDAQLALVIAHEFAHVLLGHANLSSMSFDTNAARAEEREADYVGLYLVARAGFEPREAVELWPNLAAAQPRLLAGGSAHPGLGERYSALHSVCDEIEDKRRAGQPLIPGN
jgi:hypothetical protein